MFLLTFTCAICTAGDGPGREYFYYEGMQVGGVIANNERALAEFTKFEFTSRRRVGRGGHNGRTSADRLVGSIS